MTETEPEVKSAQGNVKLTKTEVDKAIRLTQGKQSGKKQATKTVIVKTVKQGAGLVSKAGDFIGRLGTLLVMIVTSINTGTIMVTSFLEGVYWKGAVHAVLLAFVHLPVIVFMVWFMCKARMQWLYRKVRPSRPGEPIVVADVENETIVYEEIVEVQAEVSDKEKEEKIETKKVPETGVTARKGIDRMNKLKLEEKLNNGLKAGEQINMAFEMS